MYVGYTYVHGTGMENYEKCSRKSLCGIWASGAPVADDDDDDISLSKSMNSKK